MQPENVGEIQDRSIFWRIFHDLHFSWKCRWNLECRDNFNIQSSEQGSDLGCWELRQNKPTYLRQVFLVRAYLSQSLKTRYSYQSVTACWCSKNVPEKGPT